MFASSKRVDSIVQKLLEPIERGQWAAGQMLPGQRELAEQLNVSRTPIREAIRRLAADGLVEWHEQGLTVTTTGRQFIRNICSAFDLHMQRNKQKSGKQLYSKAI